ncbi:hypothetical protein KJ903_05455 [Patescibacteria group bacterium]|nr:hypothetical protein [Patescibacteria group bacterium]
MKFECRTEGISLTVQFTLDKDGRIEGFVGTAPLPSEINEVVFFVDGLALEKSPWAAFDPATATAKLALGGFGAKGNLYLRLKSGGELWANLGASGGWVIKGAKVVAKDGKTWLEVSTCSGK